MPLVCRALSVEARRVKMKSMCRSIISFLLISLPVVVPFGPLRQYRTCARMALSGACGFNPTARNSRGGQWPGSALTPSHAGRGGTRGVRQGGRRAVCMNLGTSPFGDGFLGVGPAEIVVICVVGYFLLGPTEVPRYLYCSYPLL